LDSDYEQNSGSRNPTTIYNLKPYLSIMDRRTLIHRLIIGLVFGFIVFLMLAFINDFREVSRTLYSFRWELFPIIIGLTLINYLLRGIKFHYYLLLIGAEKIALVDSFRLFVSGFPLAVTPGKAGEVLKGVWINKLTNIPTSQGIAVVVAERISDGLAVLLLTIFGVQAYPQYWPAFISVLTILLSIIIVIQIRPLALWGLSLLNRIPVLKKASAGLFAFYEGSHILFKPGPILISVGLGTISWLGEGIGFYLILVGLGLPASLNLLSSAVFILAFSTLIGAISTLPGGLGAAEMSISGMLILLLALDTNSAATGTLLIRFATLWFGVGLGLITWLLSPDFFDVANEENSNSSEISLGGKGG
jgi:uncharacterized protein (TIRG00374 family)